jgi:DNA-binding transcriptional LysR family regulator
MQWSDLRIFLGVARAGQFLAAARQLQLDHATVSRRVSALERDLHARLFIRRTTGVTLTAAGQRLLASAERIESEALRVQAALSDRDVELSGTVRVGAPDGFSTYYLARCFAAFAPRHPGITVQLVPTPQLGELGKRETDIVIALTKPETGRYVTRKLTDYSLGIFASRDYLAVTPAPADAEGLRAHRLIGYVEGYAYSSALDYVRILFGDAPTAFECTSAVGQLEAVRAGLGLGIVHDFIAVRHADLVRVLPQLQAVRTYWIIEHEDVRDLGRVRAVHDHIVACVAADRRMFQPSATSGTASS